MSKLPPFEDFLDHIEDHRNPDLIHYPLKEVLFLILVGTLCGCDKLTMISIFGEEKLEWFQQYYPYDKGIPSHDTLGRILGMLDKKEFEKLFAAWVGKHFDLSTEELLHLDGKHLKGSAEDLKKTKKRSEGGQYAEIIVNLYASGAGIALAHHNVSDKMSEVEGALTLLDWFSLEGCCITGDSNFCRRRIIDKIIAAKADYIFGLKGNSYSFFEATKASFADQAIAKKVFETQERGHGRVEHRIYRSIGIEQLGEAFQDFYTHPKQLIEVQRMRTVSRKEKTSEETHYYITSLTLPLKEVASKIRKHWLIENQLHYVLDVAFKEDESRVRTKNGATNLSLIRKLSFNLLKAQNIKGSIKSRQLRCAISDQQRTNVLENIMMR